MSESRLTQEEQTKLLELARKTIADILETGKPEPPESAEGILAEERGAFVSLHKHGQLRGCIGTFIAHKPLVQTVQEMASSASQADPRFPPVSASELAEVDLEISVLSPLRQISDVSEIEVGRHGVFITRGFNSGVLLPQVATQYGWDRDTFLQQTCTKAGLPRDTWKETETKIEIFEAQVFGEKPER